MSIAKRNTIFPLQPRYHFFGNAAFVRAQKLATLLIALFKLNIVNTKSSLKARLEALIDL